MRVALECMYCGHKWTDTFAFTRKKAKCPVCSDSHIKSKDLSVKKVDYYQGSPPFPPKEGYATQYDHNPFADYTPDVGVDFGFDPGGD